MVNIVMIFIGFLNIRLFTKDCYEILTFCDLFFFGDLQEWELQNNSSAKK